MRIGLTPWAISSNARRKAMCDVKISGLPTEDVKKIRNSGTDANGHPLEVQNQSPKKLKITESNYPNPVQ